MESVLRRAMTNTIIAEIIITRAIASIAIGAKEIGRAVNKIPNQDLSRSGFDLSIF